MQIKVINKSSNELPKYATPGSAGMDLCADVLNINEKFLYNCDLLHDLDNTKACLIIQPGGRALIPTGLHLGLPVGYEAMVRPRSGLALKHGVTVLNTPGCIDFDYTGDVGIILINHGFEPFRIQQGDRIAQLIISKVEIITWEPTDTLEETQRGSGGFGSTNIQ